MRRWDVSARANGLRPALLAAGILFLTAIGAFAADKINWVNIDGDVYSNVFDVHPTDDGRIAILYHVGGVTVDRADLPKGFLASWGLGDTNGAAVATAPAPTVAETNADAAKATWLQWAQSVAIADAAKAGMIREIDGRVYDLRAPPAGWEQFNEAKVYSFDSENVILDLATAGKQDLVAVRRLPTIVNAADPVTAWAKLVGMMPVDVPDRRGGVIPMNVRIYDYGRICAPGEITPAILASGMLPSGAASAMPPSATPAPEPGSQMQPMPDFPQLRGVHATGTGFFVSSDGWVVTCYHVVANAAKVRVLHGFDMFDADVTQTDRGNDVALLKIETSDMPWLSITRLPPVALGEPVFTIGFPDPQLQGMEPKYDEGIVSSLDGFRDDPAHYQMSVPVQPGNSGGPLCNMQGDVVGIVNAQLNPHTAMEFSGATPQNVNSAVKAKFAVPLLQMAVPGRDFPVMPDGMGNTPQTIRTHARDAVVMILTYSQP